MSDKFQNKYRISSARAQWWDYRQGAAYFVTICTHNREMFFGNITEGKMKLSPVGVVADILWHEIKNHAKNVELGEFVVMPNHIHGILILNGPVPDLANVSSVEALHATPLRKDGQMQPLQPSSKNECMSGISPKSGSLSTIIRSYKSAVTKHCHRLGFDFSWQSRFHDHIIRDKKSFATISDYIRNNPSKWDEDNFYSTDD